MHNPDGRTHGRATTRTPAAYHHRTEDPAGRCRTQAWPGAALAEAQKKEIRPRAPAALVPGGSVPPISLTGSADRPLRFVLIWALAWAGIGLGVGKVIVIVIGMRSVGLPPEDPIIPLSVFFAEVVGLTALSSSRLIFPYFARLPYVPRLLLQVATLGGGALLGTLTLILMSPLYVLHRMPLITLMGVVNAFLALVVGIAVNTYESMKRQIERSYGELRNKEAFEREMEIAREVQEQLFPKTVPYVQGLEIAGICMPAAGVGGDYYDYLSFSDQSVGLVVADVSGKGISAALVMAGLQASVRNVIGPNTPPCEANHRLNEILYRSTSASRYATMFLGLFDSRTRILRYSNAGHNPPMLLSQSGHSKLSAGGLPLGILDKSVYAEASQVLEPGDILLLYTDGAVEAANPSSEEFGLDRLVRFLHARREMRSLTTVINETIAELQIWTKNSPQQDDITLVVARAVGVN
jgi:serine phosphatase RsbU (regulator of sigma subunit)